MIGALLGCAAGIIIALFFNINIPMEYTVYTGVAILAALDAAIGALVSVKEKKFEPKKFFCDIIFNITASILLVFLGKNIGLELSLAAIVLFGAKILKKISIFRKFLLNKCEKKGTIEEERLQKD